MKRVALGVLSAGVMCLASSSSAATAATSCTATAVRVDVLGQHFERAVANAASTPCVRTSAGGQSATVGGSVLASGPSASTYPSTRVNANAGASAFASITDAIIPYTQYLSVSGVQSSAVGTCRDGVPAFGGTANVARLYTEADGKQPELPDEGVPATIPVPGGTLVVNEKIQTPTSMTRRALRLDTPFFDVLLGEASVSIDSCPAPRPTTRQKRRAGRMR